MSTDLSTLDQRGITSGDAYMDWSTRDAGSYLVEVGDGETAVQVQMSRAEMEALRDQLTLTLMLDA